MIVDFHTHAHLPVLEGKLGEYGPEHIRTEPDGRHVLRIGQSLQVMSPTPEGTLIDRYLNAMERQGVDVIGLSLSPAESFFFVPADRIVGFVELANDTLAGLCRERPEKLFFLANLPLQNIPAAIDEARRAVTELDARGVMFGSDDIAGRDLDDEAFDPLYAAIAELGVPIFSHPSPANIERQIEDKYGFSWIPGMEFRATVAVTSLIFGGVLDRFPGLQVCVSHGGGTVPFLLGKLEHQMRVKIRVGTRSEIKAELPFREYLSRNFFFDTFVEARGSLQLLVDVMGADRLLLGQHTGLGATGNDEIGNVRSLGLPPAEEAKILGGNASQLFGLAR